MPSMHDREVNFSLDTITPENREDIKDSLDAYAARITDIQNGDELSAYADTATDAEILDRILGNAPQYQALMSERNEASRKAMQGGDDTTRQQGLSEAQAWIEKIRSLGEEKNSSNIKLV